jgi:hypothetical protein
MNCTACQKLGIFSLALKYRESRYADQYDNQFRYKSIINPDPNWINIGPNLGMADKYTDANGTFWDDPFGVCATSSFVETLTQPISILLSGINFPVRTNNWTTKSTAGGHGSVTNGTDVTQSH